MISIKDKNVFLSGPMMGIEHFNVEAFAKAHAILKEMGVGHVYNPGIEYLESVGRRSHAYWMRRCVQVLTQGTGEGKHHYDYQLVVQLKGWSKSEGCRTEAQVAGACGIPCITLKRLLKEAEDKTKLLSPHVVVRTFPLDAKGAYDTITEA